MLVSCNESKRSFEKQGGTTGKYNPSLADYGRGRFFMAFSLGE